VHSVHDAQVCYFNNVWLMLLVFFFFKFLFKQLSVAEAPFSGDGLIASGALSSPVYGRVVGT